MKDWQKGKLETILKKYGKGEALRALETVKAINHELESKGEERTWTDGEIEEAVEVCRKWQ